MPNYKFYDTTRKKEYFLDMKISELDNYLKDNPHVEQRVNGAPSLGYRTNNPKIDSGFRDVLKEVKKKHRGSTIDTH